MDEGSQHRFFGEIALEMGLVRTDQILNALLRQARDRRAGRRAKMLGEDLVENGDLSPDDVSVVLGELFTALRVETE